MDFSVIKQSTNQPIQQNLPQQQNKKLSLYQKFCQWWEKAQLWVKPVYHYVDLITDFIFIITLLQSKETPLILVGFVLLMFLFIERFFTYKLLIEMKEGFLLKNNSSNNNNPNKNNQGYNFNFKHQQQLQINPNNSTQQQNEIDIQNNEKFKLFLVVALYMDYLYLLKHKNKLNIQSIIIKKGAIELYCENIVFSICAIGVAYSSVFYDDQSIKPYLAVSIISSLGSTIYWNYKMYLYSITKYKILKPKKDIRFNKLPLDTQLFLSDPFQLGQIKFISQKLKTHTQLYKQSASNNSNTYKTMNIQSQKLSFVKSLYLIIYLATWICSISLLLVMASLTNADFQPELIFFIGVILGLPQIIVYVKSKFILGLPFISGLFCIIFIFPIKIELIPFIKEIQENWVVNFLPSWYVILIKQAYSTAIVYLVHQVINEGNFKLANQETDKSVIFRTQQSDSQVKHYFQAITICFFIFSIPNVCLLVQQLYSNIQLKCCKKQEKQKNNSIFQKSNRNSFLNVGSNVSSQQFLFRNKTQSQKSLNPLQYPNKKTNNNSPIAHSGNINIDDASQHNSVVINNNNPSIQSNNSLAPQKQSDQINLKIEEVPDIPQEIQLQQSLFSVSSPKEFLNKPNSPDGPRQFILLNTPNNTNLILQQFNKEPKLNIQSEKIQKKQFSFPNNDNISINNGQHFSKSSEKRNNSSSNNNNLVPDTQNICTESSSTFNQINEYEQNQVNNDDNNNKKQCNNYD